jgi:hypothetical protein
VLLDTLRALEVALHRPETRLDGQTLVLLLHERFREFGRSGRIYTKAEMIDAIHHETHAAEIWAQDFHVEPLAEGLALLTYRSAHVGVNGKLERHINRASLWRLTEHGWQMLFHQGTPTEGFERRVI